MTFLFLILMPLILPAFSLYVVCPLGSPEQCWKRVVIVATYVYTVCPSKMTKCLYNIIVKYVFKMFQFHFIQPIFVTNFHGIFTVSKTLVGQ